MRTLLFFDLPTLTLQHQKSYRHFVRDLKKCGFYRLQESVFVRMNINKQAADSIIDYIDTIKPSEGNVMVITITEKQFSKMRLLLGEMKTDVVTSDSRIINL